MNEKEEKNHIDITKEDLALLLFWASVGVAFSKGGYREEEVPRVLMGHADAIGFALPYKPEFQASSLVLPEETRLRLKAMLIRPDHECTESYQEAKMMAGSAEQPWRCSKCGKYGMVNNVCRECGNDERARYGDFEREMSPEEWESVKRNLPVPTKQERSRRKVASE